MPLAVKVSARRVMVGVPRPEADGEPVRRTFWSQYNDPCQSTVSSLIQDTRATLLHMQQHNRVIWPAQSEQ